MKPMEDEIDLGRDLMGQEDTRAMGVAKLTEAQGSLLRMIAENANNPQLLAKSWDDLRKVQEAVFNRDQQRCLGWRDPHCIQRDARCGCQ